MSNKVSEFEYSPVAVGSFPSGVPLTCDIYVYRGKRHVLLQKASTLLTEEHKRELLQAGLQTLWVRQAHHQTTVSPRQLVGLLSQSDEQVPTLAKSGLLYGSAMSIARQTIGESISKRMLSDVHDLMAATVGYLARSTTALAGLFSVMQNDFSVYTHSVNVSVYALGLARYAGITDEAELRDLGLGAFLHDIGKAKVSAKILRKPGPLSITEWQTMRKHPGWGHALLSRADEVSSTVATVVAQHHERLDGSGYPAGLGSNALLWTSKVVAIADTFEAMTSERPYRSGQERQAALGHLQHETRAKLDCDLVSALSGLLNATRPIGPASSLNQTASAW